MKRSALDPSRRLDLYCRKNRAVSKTFTFVDSDGESYCLIYEEFSFSIKRYVGDYKNILLLEVGYGISISDCNKLILTITQTQSIIEPGEYYWELFKNDDNQTWLNGKFFVHDGEFDGVINDSTLLQVEDDNTIQVTINI